MESLESKALPKASEASSRTTGEAREDDLLTIKVSTVEEMPLLTVIWLLRMALRRELKRASPSTTGPRQLVMSDDASLNFISLK